MWTTSMPMQPARAKASACTGDGPACPALSSTMDACPELPARTSSRSQTSSTVVGAFMRPIVALRAAETSGGLGTGALAEQARQGEPSERKRHEQVGQVVSVNAVRTVRLGGPVQRLAVGQHMRFGELVEAVDQELHDEDEQENRGDLEKAPEIHAVSVARPEERDERRDERARGGAGGDVHRLHLEEERVHQHGGLHAF